MLNRRDTLKLFASVGVAGAATPLLSACSGSGSGSSGGNEPVNVAFVYPQTGPLHLMGDEMNAGFELYLRQHSNLLGGRPIKVNKVDEGSSASEGAAAVNAVLKGSAGNPRPDVIVGIASSAVMSAVRDAVEKAQVPLVGSNGSPAGLLSPKYIWRVSYVNGEAGGTLANYFNQRGTDHVYVYDDGSVDGTAEANAFRLTFAGTKPSSSGQMAAALSQIQNGHAQAVVAACNGAAAAAFLKAYRSAGISKPLYGPGFLTEGYVLDDAAVANAAHRVFTVMNYSADLDNDANRQFASAYFAAQNNTIPSTYAMASYDALNVLDRAIGLIKGDVTAHTINPALGSVGQFDSPRGPWQFNQVRTPEQTWYLRQVQKDGRVWQNSVLQRVDAPVVQA
jgi:branched-chain amino acid transport system substrate-binding protein